MEAPHTPLDPPIFIAGTGRSGTTALARMLGLHPNIFPVRWESQFVVAQDGLLELASAGYPEEAMNAFAAKMRGYWFRRIMNEGTPSEYAAGLCVDVEAEEIEDAISFLRARTDTDDAIAVAEAVNRGFVDRVFDGATRRAGGTRWCEKTPRSILYVAELADLYPGAAFIHIIRDGRDVAASMVERQFWPVAASPHHPSMRRFRGEVTFEKAMDYWETVLQLGRRSASTAKGLRYIEIRLEDLAQDPRGIVEYLLTEIGEPMSNRMLRFDLSRSNLGRWETDLSPEQQRFALERYGDALASEGYGSSATDSRTPSSSDQLGLYVVSHQLEEIRLAPIPHQWREAEELEARRSLETGRFPDDSALAYIQSLGARGGYVDAGAHIGARAVFFARFTEADHVLAVEPRDDHRAHAAENLELNGLTEHVDLLDAISDVHDEPPNDAPVIDDAPPSSADAVAAASPSVVFVDCRRVDPSHDGLARLIHQSLPRVFLKAPEPRQLEAIDDALIAYGYRRSALSFGESQVHELLPPNADPLPFVDVAKSAVLEHDGLPGVEDRSSETRIRGTSTLRKGQRSFYQQDAPGFGRPPRANLLPPGTRRIFVEAILEADPGIRCSLFVIQYASDHRTFTDRIRLHSATFQFVDIDAETTATRLALRIGGAGSYSIDRLRLHCV